MCGVKEVIARVREMMGDVVCGEDVCWGVASGRVNLIGDHTDYNDGLAMPMAIPRYVVVGGVVGNGNDSVEVVSDGYGEGDDGWSRYACGVVGLVLERLNARVRVRLWVGSSVPIGAGLSSSAAVGVGIVRCVLEGLGERMDGLEIAQLCQRAEHEFAGVRCGLLDQMAIVFGCGGGERFATMLDCRSMGIERVEIADEVGFVVIDSGVQRVLGETVYGERRGECERAAEVLGVSSLREVDEGMLGGLDDEVLRDRAGHVVGENARVGAFGALMGEGAYERAGEVMYASHASLRDLYVVSCEGLDVLVECAKLIGVSGGVYGARMTGGGMGGCVVVMVERSRSEEILDELRTRYAQRGFEARVGLVV